MGDITVELKSNSTISVDISTGGQIVVDITARGPEGKQGLPGKTSDIPALTNMEIEALLGV